MAETPRYCKCELESERIKCDLPITLPTSKVRIKRIIVENGTEEIIPIPSRKTILEENDYIEWQISYLHDNKLVEFGIILKEFVNKGYITNDEICNILRSVENIETFEENFKIRRDLETPTRLCGFTLIYEKTPILRLMMSDGCFIDIVLRHKQRAVGYQAMVYIYIPISNKNLRPVNTDKPLLGRCAYEREKVSWFPTKEHVEGLLKAFLIASTTHRRDIEMILKKYLLIRC